MREKVYGTIIPELALASMSNICIFNLGKKKMATLDLQ